MSLKGSFSQVDEHVDIPPCYVSVIDVVLAVTEISSAQA